MFLVLALRLTNGVYANWAPMHYINNTISSDMGNQVMFLSRAD